MKTTLFTLVLAVIMSGICVAQAVEAPPPVVNTSGEAPMYLMPGDVVYIRIPVLPDLSHEYTIAENGKIYFQVIDDADLGAFDTQYYIDEKTNKPAHYMDAKTKMERGCTEKELEDSIKKKLKEFFNNPEVSVELVSYTVRGAYQVSIYGEIQNSSSFRYHEGMTLLDLLIQGGAVSDTADLSSVRIVRGDLIILRDITDLVYGRSLLPNMLLQSGDYVIIPQQQPQSKIKVLVLGKVGKVGSVFLPQGSTVLDALAAANGPEGRAGLGKAYIIRLVDDRPTAVPVDIKALINRLDLAQNRTLADGDVFFIPESSGVDLNNLMSNLSFFNMLKSTKDNYTNEGK